MNFIKFLREQFEHTYFSIKSSTNFLQWFNWFLFCINIVKFSKTTWGGLSLQKLPEGGWVYKHYLRGVEFTNTTWGGCFSITNELLTRESRRRLRPSDSSGRIFILLSWLNIMLISFIYFNSQCYFHCIRELLKNRWIFNEIWLYISE